MLTLQVDWLYAKKDANERRGGGIVGAAAAALAMLASSETYYSVGQPATCCSGHFLLVQLPCCMSRSV